MKRAFFLAIVIAGLLNTVVPAQAPDALKFFKDYFVTGDYVVAGGLAVGQVWVWTVR